MGSASLRRPGLAVGDGLRLFPQREQQRLPKAVPPEGEHRAGPQGLSMASQIMASISAQKNPSKTWA